MARVRFYQIDRGNYSEMNYSDGTRVVGLTIYDTDDDFHTYYAMFTFFNDMTAEVVWDDVDENKELIHMDINCLDNYERDNSSIYDLIKENSNIDMNNYKFYH